MKELNTNWQVHVNVCTNERTDGRISCKPLGGQQFFEALKRKTKEAGIAGTHWITRTGCLGYCNDVGTTVVIHRRGQASRWYSEVTASDLPAIWSEITKS